MAHRADAALHLLRIGDSAQCRRNHVAMLERRSELIPFIRIVSQPMQQLRESPFARVNAAAPPNRFQPLAMRGVGNLRRFALRAMIAPKVILVQRLHVLVDGNHRRARRIERNRLNLIAANARLLQDFAASRRQRAHVIFMRLRRVLRIFTLAVQRIFGDGRIQQPSLAVHQRNAHAQGSEIDSRNNRHQQAPFSQPW